LIKFKRSCLFMQNSRSKSLDWVSIYPCFSTSSCTILKAFFSVVCCFYHYYNPCCLEIMNKLWIYPQVKTVNSLYTQPMAVTFSLIPLMVCSPESFASMFSSSRGTNTARVIAESSSFSAYFTACCFSFSSLDCF